MVALNGHGNLAEATSKKQRGATSWPEKRCIQADRFSLKGAEPGSQVHSGAEKKKKKKKRKKKKTILGLSQSVGPRLRTRGGT